MPDQGRLSHWVAGGGHFVRNSPHLTAGLLSVVEDMIRPPKGLCSIFKAALKMEVQVHVTVPSLYHHTSQATSEDSAGKAFTLPSRWIGRAL